MERIELRTNERLWGVLEQHEGKVVLTLRKHNEKVAFDLNATISLRSPVVVEFCRIAKSSEVIRNP